ncbi:MAG: electron transport complex subunit D [bacterium]|nr:MAG: electron transport complex subunit D [bacterium]
MGDIEKESGEKSPEDRSDKKDSKKGKNEKPKGPKPLKVKKQEYKVWDTPSLLVTSSPHVLNTDSVEKVMWSVFLVLVPAALWGIFHFAFDFNIDYLSGSLQINYKDINDSWLGHLFTSAPFLNIVVSIIACMATEAMVNVFRKQKLSMMDGSAAVTGILLGMTLPPEVPLFIPIISSIFTISIVKHLFGGLGGNFLNPALAGRVFAMVAWPGIMYTQDYYLTSPADTKTGATALEFMKKYIASDPGAAGGNVDPHVVYSWYDQLIGNIGGSIGEVSAILLLLGAIYLFIKKYITWEIPVIYIATVFIFTFIIGGKETYFDLSYALYHVLSGGLILGALYMATDMVTCPLTSRGQLVFGASLGLLTVFIRVYGGYPEGVAFSILILNLFTPLIDRVTMPRIFGHKAKKGTS